MVALVLCIVFLIPRASDIVDALGRQNPLSIVIGLVLAIAATYATFLSWRELMRGAGHPLALMAAQRVFFLSQIGKYIPGSIWAIAAQADLGREHRVPVVKSVAVGLLTLLVSCGAGVCVAAASLPFVIPDALSKYWFVIVFVPIALAALHPAVLGLVMRLASRVMKRDFGTIRLPLPSVAKAFGWAVIAWILFGAHIATLSAALIRLDGHTFVLAIGGYSLAWLVGFLVFFLPAGLGGREAVLTALLVAGSAMSLNGAVSVAVMSRVLLTATDLLLALAAGLSRRRKGVVVRAASERS
ncbi:hypothetical protein AX769_18080 [Frondihabitans sp. PAMC 28766]|nr:hypothetical protein AX769_18080 [Frondihabitans sp. PAMC 28766]